MNASLRDRDGHDSGRIHAVTISRFTGFTITACGRPVAHERLIEHTLGPTCKQCKDVVARVANRGRWS